MQNANNKLETSLFELNKLIRTEKNMDRCPFCNAQVHLILSGNLIIGDQSEIDYSSANDYIKKSLIGGVLTRSDTTRRSTGN